MQTERDRELVKRMKEAQGHRSLCQYARDLRVTPSAVSLVYSGHRSFGGKILAALAQSSPEMLVHVMQYMVRKEAPSCSTG